MRLFLCLIEIVSAVKKLLSLFFLNLFFIFIIVGVAALNEYIYCVFVCVFFSMCDGIRLFNARGSCFLDEVYLTSL